MGILQCFDEKGNNVGVHFEYVFLFKIFKTVTVSRCWAVDFRGISKILEKCKISLGGQHFCLFKERQKSGDIFAKCWLYISNFLNVCTTWLLWCWNSHNFFLSYCSSQGTFYNTKFTTQKKYSQMECSHVLRHARKIWRKSEMFQIQIVQGIFVQKLKKWCKGGQRVFESAKIEVV